MEAIPTRYERTTMLIPSVNAAINVSYLRGRAYTVNTYYKSWLKARPSHTATDTTDTCIVSTCSMYPATWYRTQTRSSVAERPRDAPCRWKFCYKFQRRIMACMPLKSGSLKVDENGMHSIDRIRFSHHHHHSLLYYELSKRNWTIKGKNRDKIKTSTCL